MESATMSVDSGFNDLKDQLLSRRSPSENAPEQEPSEERPMPSKKFVFTKGDKTFEVDEDAEFEFMADKKPMKLSIRELKDRAAGDVAIKNRMHALAEEKKKVQSTLKEFTSLAKSDPLGALQFISEKAKDSDSEFAFDSYLNQLAAQADKLSKMDEKERKAWELEKKLTKAEQDLSLKERETAAHLRKQQILTQYEEIGESQFGSMVEAVLQNPELSDGLKSENDVLDTVEDLIQETLIQRDIINVIKEIDPRYAKDNNLIFNLSDQLRQNPDLDEEDVREIVRDILKPSQKAVATRVLSERQRASTPVEQQRFQGADDLDLLREKLIEKRNKERERKTKR